MDPQERGFYFNSYLGERIWRRRMTLAHHSSLVIWFWSRRVRRRLAWSALSECGRRSLEQLLSFCFSLLIENRAPPTCSKPIPRRRVGSHLDPTPRQTSVFSKFFPNRTSPLPSQRKASNWRRDKYGRSKTTPSPSQALV